MRISALRTHLPAVQAGPGLDRPEDPSARVRRPVDLTPARVRRGFRNIRAAVGCPAGAPKPGKSGPGRRPGSKNRRHAPSYDIGKTFKREGTLKALREQGG